VGVWGVGVGWGRGGGGVGVGVVGVWGGGGVGCPTRAKVQRTGVEINAVTVARRRGMAATRARRLLQVGVVAGKARMVQRGGDGKS